jgi:two-component system, chemotaxis family, CheB/CheR fusion protein
MLGHELRNPLAPITSALAVLRRIPPDDPRSERARALIEKQVAALSHLVDDLLDVSRLTQGKVVLDRRAVELAEVIERALETSRPMIEARHHELEVIGPTADTWVYGDAVRLTQVIANLLNNAAKYTPDRGRIQLEVVVDAQWVTIVVRDNGMGIDPALLPAVFELFVQADASLARADGGLGLGLTLVRTLVQMHGGSVEARSAGLGHGSEFRVRLPLGTKPSALWELAESEPSGAPPLRLERPARRVVIIDDNVDATEALAMLLETSGHAVRVAFDGPGGVEIARQFRPDLVLCDIGLPKMDGYSVAAELRRLVPPPVIAAITGYGQPSDLRATREAGFAFHLVKPVDPNTVLELVADLALATPRRAAQNL